MSDRRIKCAVCGRDIQRGESYQMVWYKPRQWYTLWHRAIGDHTICGIAGYQLEGDQFVRNDGRDSVVPAGDVEIVKPKEEDA